MVKNIYTIFTCIFSVFIILMEISYYSNVGTKLTFSFGDTYYFDSTTLHIH